MPWKGVTVSEQRQKFLERFGVSRRTAHTHPGHQGKWINHFEKHGQGGFHEHSRRAYSCPWQTDPAIVEELVALRKAHTQRSR